MNVQRHMDSTFYIVLFIIIWTDTKSFLKISYEGNKKQKQTPFPNLTPSRELIIHWLYPCRGSKTLSKEGMILNCIRWGGFTFGDPKSVEILLPSPLWPGVAVSRGILSIDQIDMFVNYSYLMGLRAKDNKEKKSLQKQM